MFAEVYKIQYRHFSTQELVKWLAFCPRVSKHHEKQNVQEKKKSICNLGQMSKLKIQN